MDSRDHANDSGLIHPNRQSKSSRCNARPPPSNITTGSSDFNRMDTEDELQAPDHDGGIKIHPADPRTILQLPQRRGYDCGSSIMLPLSRPQTLPHVFQHDSDIAGRRRFNLSLSPFKDGFTLRLPGHVLGHRNQLPPYLATKSADEIAPYTVPRPTVVRSKSLGPLTPPEDVDIPFWSQHTFEHTATASHPRSEHNDSHRVMGTPSQATGSINTSRPHLGMMGQESHTVLAQASICAPWLQRGLGVAGGAFDRNDTHCTKEIVSQVLPCHGTDRRPIKTYELICDYLDQVLFAPQFTVTHIRAVRQGLSLEDFPKSPPVTPSFSGRESYFESPDAPQTEHQNMFTNLARVPMYHEMATNASVHTATTQRNVMAAKADLIVLERYIPPVSITEAEDFFNAMSDRSYLADRLNELSIGGGSLLLVYPTHRGSQTFQKKFVAPIIDPIVLGMTITHGLTAAVAETIATMASVKAMMDVKQMEDKIFQLCDTVAVRTSSRLPANKFVIAHSETAEVPLDRDTWVGWFVEQEQASIKDALIQYHKRGGRIPDVAVRNEEITASMIAREVVEGFRKSTKNAGDVAVEVGVFVIRRLRK